MTRRRPRLVRVGLAVGRLAFLAAAVIGCGSDSEDSGSGSESGSSLDRASEKPEETAYGFVQAMAAGDVEAACQFTKYAPEGGGEELPVHLTDAGGAQERLEACIADLTVEFRQQPGSEYWKEAATVPMEEYEVAVDSADEGQMEVGIPGDLEYQEKYGDSAPGWEMARVETDIVKYQGDLAWYI